MGGAQQIVYEISDRLKSSNRDVLIISGLSDLKSSLSAHDNKILDQVKEEKIPIKIIPYLSDRISFLSDIKALVKIIKILKENNPSIVHIHSSKTGILARLACWLLSIKKVIYHVHGWSFSKPKWFAQKLFLWLERTFYYLTKQYIFVCHKDMVDFIDFGGNPKIISKSKIIYPGANYLKLHQQTRYRNKLRNNLGIKEDEHIIGTVGRLDYQKNPQMFVDIISDYSQFDNNAKFLWIGKGSLENEVKEKIKDEGLTDKFILPGYVEDVEQYFSVFDTFTITSRYEGLPVTILKSLSCEVPVVAFQINGINDLAKDFKSVLGVKPFSKDEFVKKLIKAKTMKNNEKKIIKAEARYVVENLNMRKMYQKILQVYDSI